MLQRLRTFWTPLRLLEAAGVFVVIYVTLWSLHPGLLLSSSTITGGDTGSHLALPAYLRTQGNLFNLTPWYPGWFAGMPAYTYYFVLPDVLATLASYLINFSVAFKLATVLGSVLIPVAAYAMGRLFRAPRPVPLALSMATLPFLFDASYTIDGGNLFSTMAGEYAFSLSLAFCLVTIGLFARGVRTGRGYWLAAIGLSVTLASHVLPWFFDLGAAAVLVLFELLQRRGWGESGLTLVRGDYARPVRFAVGAGLLSGGLSAWWLLSFATTQRFTNSMGYANDNVHSLHAIFTTLGWFNASGRAAGDRWVIVLATVAFVVAFGVRDRLGMVLASLTALSLGAFVLDPQGVIWNERLVPYWYVTIHLSAGWLVGYVFARWVGWAQRRRGQHEAAPSPTPLTSNDASVLALEEDAGGTANEQSPHALRTTRRTLRATVAIIVLGVLSTVPGLVAPAATALGLATGGNQVTSWAQWNYSGYQAKAAWPEYHDLIATVQRVSHHYGCGRAMWEYNTNENRFGTPMALMLLPYWTNNCVSSMEGLFFESSATTPYHFLDQAELSAGPSDPQVGLPYGPLNVAQGVRHLQMLGVKYYIAFSPLVIARANRDPQLHFVASTKAWPSPGVQWRIYLIEHSPIVQALATLPNVVSGVASRTSWLQANTSWWLRPSLWGTLVASDGLASWPHVRSVNALRAVAAGTTTVSRVVVGTQSLSFHVSRLGVPVLVKVSYFPRWHARGAEGPYRVSPNLMVVVPTSHDVAMVYGSSPALVVGNAISDLTVAAGLVTWWLGRRRRRIARQ